MSARRATGGLRVDQDAREGLERNDVDSKQNPPVLNASNKPVQGSSEVLMIESPLCPKQGASPGGQARQQMLQDDDGGQKVTFDASQCF